MGVPTVMITGSANTIGVMPCNPAIGGPAKSQIVSEVDALGGEMGRAADATFMQMKLLNRSRGAAVQCVRSQNDKYAYQRYMQTTLERTPGIEIVTGMVVDIRHDTHENTAILADGTRIRGTAIVVTTGTFLSACMHTGEAKTDGGRVGEAAALGLSDTFRRLGLRLGRFY
jgi:tRNA uridine 5-carboxymethylaminomethyl modification enzyme